MCHCHLQPATCPCAPKAPSIWLPFLSSDYYTLGCVTPTTHLGPPGPVWGGKGRTQPTSLPDLGCQAQHGYFLVETSGQELGSNYIPCVTPMWGQYPTPTVQVCGHQPDLNIVSVHPQGRHHPPISQRRECSWHPLSLQSPALDLLTDHTPTE